jgi:hypothetical protein
VILSSPIDDRASGAQNVIDAKLQVRPVRREPIGPSLIRSMSRLVCQPGSTIGRLRHMATITTQDSSTAGGDPARMTTAANVLTHGPACERHHSTANPPWTCTVSGQSSTTSPTLTDRPKRALWYPPADAISGIRLRASMCFGPPPAARTEALVTW